jgi:hypothetical protein
MVADLEYNPDSKEQWRHQMYFDDELDYNSEVEFNDSFISDYAIARIAHEFGHSQFCTAIHMTVIH